MRVVILTYVMSQMKCASIARRSSVVLVYALFAFVLGVPSLAGATSLALGSSLPMVGGHGLAIVTSGSMQPAIRRGDVVLTRDVSGSDRELSAFRDIKVNDIISYEGVGNDNLSITHRVVARTVTQDGVTLATRGDAVVGAVPSVVPASRVEGKVVAVVPYLGLILIALGSRMVLAGTVVLLLTVLFARGWSTPKRRPRIQDSTSIGEE